ncbi:MAG: helix-turn-helix transcriptional regulator [Chlamydiae bacterium]|nr:helix-turn-helix transcriptional regulator [Chlamydiota bacterium]
MTSTIKDFGKRLAEIRKARGLSQRDLARELGISNRMVAYYEAQTQYVPSNLLIPLTKILKIPVEELLGVKNFKEYINPQAKSLWKKLRKAELLPKKDQKALLDHLEALLQRVPQSEPSKIPSLHKAAQQKIKVG